MPASVIIASMPSSRVPGSRVPGSRVSSSRVIIRMVVESSLEIAHQQGADQTNHCEYGTETDQLSRKTTQAAIFSTEINGVLVSHLAHLPCLGWVPFPCWGSEPDSSLPAGFSIASSRCCSFAGISATSTDWLNWIAFT